MTDEQIERAPEPGPEPEASALPEAEAAAPAEPAAATLEPAPTPAPEPELTPLEIQRRLALASQPRAWQPGDAELDPNSEAGWQAAAAHELPAIRPEDLPTPDPPAWTEPGTAENQAPAEVALAPRDRVWRRGARRARSGAQRAARPTLLIGLFLIGVGLGLTTWVRMQPPALAGGPPPPALEPGTTADIPTQVQSLVAALSTDNHTQLQTVVPAEPYRLLAGELARRGITSIAAANALASYVNGEDSATEILIRAQDSTGSPVLFNLVVHLHAGTITEFR